MICFTLAVPFANINLNHNQNVITVAAAENPAFDEIMRDVRITQDGYVFGKKDFEISQDQSKTIYTLYVNTSITITHLSKVYDLQITISTLGDNYTTTKLLEFNEFYGINMPHKKEYSDAMITAHRTPTPENLAHFAALQRRNGDFSTLDGHTLLPLDSDELMRYDKTVKKL